MHDFRHKEKHMENIFNNMKRQFQEREKDMRDNWSDFENLEDLEWNTKSNWAFYYYQKTNNNWEESSYNVNGKRNDWEEWWTINMSGTNVEWKDFFYSWSIHNWKSQWTLIDEDGNTKDMDLQQLDLKEIYNDSNNLSK